MWTYRPTHVANRIKCTPGKSCESDRHTDMWRKSTFLQICKRNALSSVSLVFILLKEEDISSCSPRPTLAHLSQLFWNTVDKIEKYAWSALSSVFLIKHQCNPMASKERGYPSFQQEIEFEPTEGWLVFWSRSSDGDDVHLKFTINVFDCIQINRKLFHV